MYQVRGRWFAMVMGSRYFQLRKEDLVGQVEKMSHGEVTCSVGRRNDAVESARKRLIPLHLMVWMILLIVTAVGLLLLEE